MIGAASSTTGAAAAGRRTTRTAGECTATASTSTASSCGFPLRNGVPLPGSFARCRGNRGAESEETGLHSGVGLQLQNIFTVPADVDACRNSHDGRGAVALALVAFGFVFGRIPGLGCSPCSGSDRNAGNISLVRNLHSPAPVFGDQRFPITGQIHCRRGLCRRRWSGRLPAARTATTTSATAREPAAPASCTRGRLSASLCADAIATAKAPRSKPPG